MPSLQREERGETQRDILTRMSLFGGGGGRIGKQKNAVICFARSVLKVQKQSMAMNFNEAINTIC